jgi:hypothetical protein
VLTLLLYGLLAVFVIAGLFGLAVFVLPKGEQISAPTPDARPWEALPDRPLLPEDIIATRLPVALRGYRFAETDLLLDRLTLELRERDEEIERLRGGTRSRRASGDAGAYDPDGFGPETYNSDTHDPDAYAPVDER